VGASELNFDIKFISQFMRIKTTEDFQAMLSQCGEFLSLVIKSHHSIDQLLNLTLEEALPRATSVELKRVSFLLKVDFTIGLGILRPEFRPIYNSINSVRNNFAHDPYAEISEDNARKTLSTLKGIRPKILPDEFCNPFEIRNVMETLFAIGFINLQVAYEALCVRKAESLIAGQMLTEALSENGRLNRAHVSAKEDFQIRIGSYLSQNYPGIKPR